MEIPIIFWESISGAIQLISIVYVLYLASKIYRNIRAAHKEIVNNTIEYKGCKLYPEKIINKYY